MTGLRKKIFEMLILQNLPHMIKSFALSIWISMFIWKKEFKFSYFPLKIKKNKMLFKIGEVTFNLMKGVES